jgi:hypothetical protein
VAGNALKGLKKEFPEEEEIHYPNPDVECPTCGLLYGAVKVTVYIC